MTLSPKIYSSVMITQWFASICVFSFSKHEKKIGHLNCVFQKNRSPFSILDKRNENFRDLFNTLDLVRSSLHRESVGAVRKSAPIIEVEHESLFWKMKLLSYSSPRILQKTVFFYVGLHLFVFHLILLFTILVSSMNTLNTSL